MNHNRPSNQQLVEQRKHWLWGGYDLGHLITLGTLIVGITTAVLSLKTDIAVLQTKLERLDLQVDRLETRPCSTCRQAEPEPRSRWHSMGGAPTPIP